MSTVFFNSALKIALNTVKRNVNSGDIVLVRDLNGRIRVLAPGHEKDLSGEHKTAFDKCSQELADALGAYGFPKDRAVLYASALELGDDTFRDRQLIDEEGALKVWLLDRQIIGQDWMRASLKRRTTNRRVTFFGIKGGVGRSTALVIWAWRLAKQGKKVLIFDLDLEFPGVSSTLLPDEYLPNYGIVDWFVEDGVGQANVIENALIASSPLARNLPGEIKIVPAFGQDKENYLPKLARCYAEFSGNGHRAWGERLQQMVETVEDKEMPDLVILDSRAGLHDIAAVSVTRMDADAFIFAADSLQTWNAYAFLFKHWQQYHPKIKDFRRKLQIVAAMIPETLRAEYLNRFKERSWGLFREHLYDEAEAQTTDVFSFDVNDEEAPHYPISVYWNRALQEFDPLQESGGVDEQNLETAMGKFMTEAERIVFTGEENL
ncbi:MAG: AAA family ATPase [Candidatus Magnetobacterium sp. LHC-1]|uniref:Tyrosine-protein kinase family protein n=1 Tax=Candidatus Magnetobacterium casense TaxID=1455061 RepID=A0ABS6RZ93_9BACT|nr:AAA family ATPase [Candidatus Magnetobacterium casensis]MBF0609209.1 tyrosine-protein kinase family protein [Nitrospirota bacterium]MBV6341916.1 tyrosine-protein kinase family protein [Candidatus Magnetobacterium casensis]